MATEYKLHRNPQNPSVAIFGRILEPGEKTRVGDIRESVYGGYEPVSLLGIAVHASSETLVIRPAMCTPLAPIAHKITAKTVVDPDSAVKFLHVTCTRCQRFVADYLLQT